MVAEANYRTACKYKKIPLPADSLKSEVIFRCFTQTIIVPLNPLFLVMFDVFTFKKLKRIKKN